jgi:hypothetical protein
VSGAYYGVDANGLVAVNPDDAAVLLWSGFCSVPQDVRDESIQIASPDGSSGHSGSAA